MGANATWAWQVKVGHGRTVSLCEKHNAVLLVGLGLHSEAERASRWVRRSRGFGTGGEAYASCKSYAEFYSSVGLPLVVF